MPPRLILNADDFGLTPGINRAIAELHQAGVLTSATLMATGPAFVDAVRIAQANPTLGVGCHLVFVDGIPVSHPEDIPSLLGADGKTFRPSLVDFAQATLRNTISPAELARETQAQIQKLQRAGLDVTHVDTHKHTHLFPQIAKTVLHIAQRCGVNAVRNPFEPEWARVCSNRASSLARSMQLGLLHRFEPAFQKIVRSSPTQLTTGGTLGIKATGKITDEVLSMLLQGRAEEFEEHDVLELCCHPGFHDEDLDRSNTRLLASRELEFASLLSFVPALKMEPNPFEFIHYGNLGVPGLQRASGQFAPNTGYEKVL